mgnify:CR=1 FL=1
MTMQDPIGSPEDIQEPRYPQPEIKHIDQIIQEIAYLRAEKRGFAPGSELDDWLEAEQTVIHQMDKETQVPETN